MNDATPMDAVVATARSRDRGSDEDIARALVCVLHYLACATLGRALPWSRAALGIAAEHREPGGVTVLGMADPVAADHAIFANAVLGQSTLAEDVHPGSLVHPGSIVIPAALAAAERVDASGREFLRAVIAGYDVACVVGAAMRTETFVQRGFRPSGVFGVLGAAAAVGQLWGFDGQRLASCLGIAGNLGAGLREWAGAGTTDIYLQNGTAARNGFHAAMLAASGFTGPETIFEGPAGLGNAVAGAGIDWASLLDRRPAAVHEVQFKRFPACSAVQTVLELAVDMANPLRHRDIERVTVFTHRHGKRNPGCDSTGPWHDVGQAQMSNQLGVALALSGSALSVADYVGAMADQRMGELAGRVAVVEDPELTAVYPSRSGARIEVTTRDGDLVTARRDRASPLTVDEVTALAAGLVPSAVFDLPRLASVRGLISEVGGAERC